MRKSRDLQDKNNNREERVDELLLRRCCVLCGGACGKNQAVLNIQECRVSLLQPVLLC